MVGGSAAVPVSPARRRPSYLRTTCTSSFSIDVHSRRRACVAGGICVACAGIISGCGGRQSILDPASRQSYDIELLWWWMLGAAAVVFFGALALLGISWLRRDTPGLPLLGEREGITEGMVLVFGIAVPVVVLVALFGVSNIYLIGKTSPPPPGSTAITIDVIGHQWWWEVRYPGTRAITANEIHIPIDTRVDVIGDHRRRNPQLLGSGAQPQGGA